MKHFLFAGTLAGLIACQTTGSQDSAALGTADPVVLLSPLQEAEVDPSMPARVWMGEHELTLWSSPGFQRRFAESYIALGDTEPELTLEEGQVMLDVAEALGAEDDAQAIELLEANLGPYTSAQFDYTLANIYFQQERTEDAIATFHSALAKFPRFQRAWNNLGLVSVLTSDFVNAKKALTRVIEMGGGTTDTFGLLAYAYLNTGDFLAAESAYRQANLLDPSNPEWKMGLAECLFNQGRYDATASLCGNLIEENPENPKLWNLQARAFLRGDKPLAAAENYEFLDKLGAANASNLNLLGDIYTAEQVFDEAAVAYSRAVQVEPEADPMRSIEAANGLASRGASEPTRQVVEAIEANMDLKGNVAARKKMLLLRARMARTDLDAGAVASALESILEIDPLDGEALLKLGEHYASEEEPERAFLYFERAGELDDFAARGKRNQAQLLVRLGRYAEALPILAVVKDLDPTPGIDDYIAEVERRSRLAD